jgi:hypothetical protein
MVKVEVEMEEGVEVAVEVEVEEGVEVKVKVEEGVKWKGS